MKKKPCGCHAAKPTETFIIHKHCESRIIPFLTTPCKKLRRKVTSGKYRIFNSFLSLLCIPMEYNIDLGYTFFYRPLTDFVKNTIL